MSSGTGLLLLLGIVIRGKMKLLALLGVDREEDATALFSSGPGNLDGEESRCRCCCSDDCWWSFDSAGSEPEQGMRSAQIVKKGDQVILP